MHKIIKTIVNFKNLCKHKLTRSKMPDMSKNFAKKRQEMLIDQKVRLHGRLYAYTDKIIKKYDPCKIKNGKCARITPCCEGCKYLTENGCSTECLCCKLWLCNYLLKKSEHSLLFSKLEKIEKVASRKNILLERGSKEDLKRYLKMFYENRRQLKTLLMRYLGKK